MERSKFGVLVANIGVTNCRAQYYTNSSTAEPIDAMEIKTASVASLEAFLELFLKSFGEGFELSHVDAVVSIATIVVDNVAYPSE